MYVYIYIWLHVLLPLSPFPASAILAGSACSKTASVAGWTSPKNSGGKIHNHLHYFFKKHESIWSTGHNYIYNIYVVCSLYMILCNIHLPIIYMYMTCISNIHPVYHLFLPFAKSQPLAASSANRLTRIDWPPPLYLPALPWSVPLLQEANPGSWLLRTSCGGMKHIYQMTKW